MEGKGGRSAGMNATLTKNAAAASEIGDAAAACHRCGEGGASGPKPDGEENRADERVVTRSDDP